MPSLKDTKRRIQSVKNTQKITNAMKLVSAAKFARANQTVAAGRPYSKGLRNLLEQVIGAAESGAANAKICAPQGATEQGDVLLLLVSSDRGLCGSLNANLMKSTLRFLTQCRKEGRGVKAISWGRRATAFLKRQQVPLLSEQEKMTEKPNFQTAKELSLAILKTYLDDPYTTFAVGFVEFRSALSQAPIVEKVLPLVRRAETAPDATVFEPAADDLLEPVLQIAFVSMIYQILLESAASEHGARMTAMDSATKNAKEVTRRLTLQYNRARQAAITKELIEITSGADAL